MARMVTFLLIIGASWYSGHLLMAYALGQPEKTVIAFAESDFLFACTSGHAERDAQCKLALSNR